MNPPKLAQTALAAAVFVGCRTAPLPEEPARMCDGATAHVWSSVALDDPHVFPDPFLAAPDDTSPTGQRLDVSSRTATWLSATPGLFRNAVDSLDGMTGFGTLGGILLRFDAPVTGLPSTLDDSTTGDGWQLLDLSGPTPTRVPFQVDVLEDGHTVVAWPARPLELGTPHAFVVTRAATAADGGCIAPAPLTRSLLGQGPLPDVPHADTAAKSVQDAVAQLGLPESELSVVLPFTTHDEVGPFLDLADTARHEPVSWVGDPLCHNAVDTGRLCRLETTVLSRRSPRGRVDASVAPIASRISVSAWMPDGDGPFPIALFNHGLGGFRGQASTDARALVDAGFAVVAMDAVEHGDHPSADGVGRLDAITGFLGVDLVSLSLDTDRLRGNFEQTNLDRIRLLSLLRQQPDLDGDGHPELDPSRIAVHGVSMGAMLTPQLLAVTPEVESAMLTVGGGRLSAIVTESPVLDDFDDLIRQAAGSQERFDRWIPLAQAALDPVDPALWAAHVTHNRFDSAPAPSVLLQVALFDEVVPAPAGFALARALDLPAVGAEVLPVDGLDAIEDDVVQGNADDGAATRGLFQLDRIGGEDSLVVPAEHTSTPPSEEAQTQLFEFAAAWLDDGLPAVVDPYTVLGTPNLD